METCLAFDKKKRALELLFKERFVTASNLQCKITGALNTKTGSIDYQGVLRKFFFSAPRSSSGLSYNAQKSKFRLGAGVSYNNRTDRFLAGATARKQFQLGNTETWLKASQDMYYDYAASEAFGVSRIQLSKSIFNFTDTQDVRILGGYRATVDRNGDWTGTPYAQLRENNWSLNTDFKSWLIKYDL
eukprot:jgi/Astpho2/6911/Aster-01778